MLTSNQLWNEVKRRNIPHEHHESDLYIPVNAETRELVNAKNYQFAKNVTVFKSQVDGKFWYDVPFAYGPYWEKVQRSVNAAKR